MRKILLTGAAVLALCGTANAAGLPVVDITLNAQTAISYAKEVAFYAKQAADMYRDYQTLVSVFNALSHPNDAAGLLDALGLATQTYMPDAGEIPSMFTGLGTLARDAENFHSVNQFFAMTRQAGYMADEMTRQTNVTANGQAFAHQSTTDLQLQNMKLGVLQAALNVAPDIQAVEYIKGLVMIQQMNMQVKTAQMQNVALLMQAEQRVTEERAVEKRFKDAQELFEQTSAVTDTLE